jgi:hypothetical protein
LEPGTPMSLGYSTLPCNDTSIWTNCGHNNGLGLLSQSFSNSLENNYYFANPAQSKSISASSMEMFGSSTFEPFVLEPSEGSVNSRLVSQDNMLIRTIRTPSSNGSLNNSPLNLPSSRCPLPAIPFVLPDCQDSMLSQETYGSSPTRPLAATSKKEPRSSSLSSSRRRPEDSQCSKCSFVFSRARDLKRHFRLHTGEKPYDCKACGETFIRSDARGKHWVARPDCFAAHRRSEK